MSETNKIYFRSQSILRLPFGIKSKRIEMYLYEISTRFHVITPNLLMHISLCNFFFMFLTKVP